MRRSRTESPRHPRYRILRRLGTGGSSSVYLAEDVLENGRRVALKVCRTRLASEELRNEFRILRELRHPGIARSFDFGRVPSSAAPYFTLEYIEGPDLDAESARLRRGGRPEDLGRLAGIYLDVIDALAYLHAKELLHLDLKPSNVVFSGDRPKLIDFGLFQRFQREDRRPARGTAYYCAPEVFTGASLDARTDLYSLGVMMYRSFTGRHPIVGATLDQVAERHRTAMPYPPARTPEGLSRIIMKLLAKAPEHRFQDAGEVGTALREVFRGAPRAAGAAGTTDLELVGRKKELAQLFPWLDKVSRGDPPRLLLVEGEPGMGKTRFLEACATEALSAGLRVIPLRLTEGEEANGLRRLLEKTLVFEPLRKSEKSRHRFLLTSLGIARDPSSLREIAEVSLEQMRSRIFRDAIEILGARAQSPLLISIDDLHLAGPELIDFIQRLGTDPHPASRPLRLGVLAASRPAADAGPGLRPPEEPGAIRLHLGPLKKADARKALLAVEGVTPRDTAAILESTRGIPALLAAAAAEARKGRFRPSRIAGAALWRLPKTLTPLARGLYLHIALLERPAHLSILADALETAPGDLQEARASLEAAGLVREMSGGFQACHEDARERLRAELGPHLIERAHAALGLQLIRTPGRKREAALHLLRGGRTEEGLRTALEAEGELRAAGRIEEALRLLDEAVSRSKDWKGRPRILEKAGELREKSGEFAEAAASYRTILEEEKWDGASISSTERLRILRRLGGVELRRGNNEAARKLFEEALELLDGAHAVGEHLDLFNEISNLYLFLGEFSKAATFVNRGLELLSTREAASLDPDTRAYHGLNFHSTSGHILLRQFEYDRARKEFRRGLELSQRVGSMSNMALILNNLGIAYHQANRLDSAFRVYERAAALARRMGDGTCYFSILCNMATIRARWGEIRASEEILKEAEKMPQVARSSRARLFFLHSRGLVEKLRLEDASRTWLECVELAEGLPDPVFARYARMYLYENEVHQGRWGSARRIGEEFPDPGGPDGRFDRAVALRRAWLEACLGHADAARLFLSSQAIPSSRSSYADLWDSIYRAATLVELGDVAEAQRLFRDAKTAFEASRQIPGAMECAIRLADADLRARDSVTALADIREARRLYALHDTSAGSRGARAWIPFLEARQALLAGKTARSHAAGLLADAAANLRDGSSWEIGWLIDLAASACEIPGASRRLEASRRRFTADLEPRDQKAYLARDHETLLGLREPRRPAEALELKEDLARIRYEVLTSLRRIRNPRVALDLALRGACARKGAIFLEAEPGIAALHGLPSGRRRLRELRLAVLRAGSGPAGSGFSAEIGAAGKQRMGVLYVEPRGAQGRVGLEDFLEAAGRMLSATLFSETRSTASAARSTPGREEMPLDAPDLRTRTLDASESFETESPRMREVITLIDRTRDSRLPVLIIGESGTGKDHLALRIHSLSPRAKGPFVAQDCSAIPLNLLEAEVFGFEEGAFTGAHRSRTGYLFTADGGTFYLDNVDSVPAELQAKLLRVLEGEAARPLGSRKERKVDVRFIASSQRDLRTHSASGGFRKDLYFRLAGITIHIPPLRERAEDVPLLVRRFQRQMEGEPPLFTPSAMEALKAYAWPGNVRELESAVHRLALTCEGRVDEAAVARILGMDGKAPSFPRWVFEGRTYRQAMDELKREYLLWLFDKFGGDMDRIAGELGLTKRNVYVRFSQAGIRPVDLRARKVQ